MNRRARIVFVVIFSILVLLGIGLIFASRLDPVVEPYDSQAVVCNFDYAIQLNPLQTKSENCPVLQSDWLQFSIKSDLNVTFSIALSKVGGGQTLLYNDTSTDLNASFPLLYSGALVTDLTDGANNVSIVNGSLSVMTRVVADTTALNTVYPFRTIGAGLVGLGALVIFLVAWNPSITSSQVRDIIVKREMQQSN